LKSLATTDSCDVSACIALKAKVAKFLLFEIVIDYRNCDHNHGITLVLCRQKSQRPHSITIAVSTYKRITEFLT